MIPPNVSYIFFYIDKMEERYWIGFCREDEFDEYLNELLADGYKINALTWDTELSEDNPLD
jgi:hypothetical protein